MTTLKKSLSFFQAGYDVPSVLFIIALGIYKILISLIYIYFISVVVAYYGFEYKPNILLSFLSWAVYLVLILFVKSDFQKPSEFFLFIFFILIITPMLILMEYGGKSTSYFSLTLASFLLINVILRLPKLKIPRIRNGNMLALSLALIMIGSVFSMFFLTNATINFDLSLVTVLREDTADIYFGGIWGYLTPWVSKVLLPFLFSVALFKKRYLVALLLIGILLLTFGITGHRSIAILPIFALGIFIARNKGHKNFYILIGFMSFLFLIFILYLYLDDVLVGSIVFRRALFLPSFLNYSYYEFFVNNEFVYYSNSFLSILLDYPYSESLSNLIIQGANTGFLGTSYAHGGPAGMIIISFLVGMILRVLDSFCGDEQDTSFFISYVSFPILAMLTSAAFFTSLLTQGVLLAILISWLYQIRVQPNKK